MYWIGKILGFLIGYKLAFIPGAIIGFLIGHYFDTQRARRHRGFDSSKRIQIERVFFESVFQLLGFLAKSDGRISEQEIASTENLMEKMRLTSDARQEAIRLFKIGARPDFDLAEVLRDFQQVCGAYGDLKQILLVYLITVALADGSLTDPEQRILRKIAADLGYTEFAFEQILRMARAQEYFYRGDDWQQRQKAYSHKVDELQMAYDALGVPATANDSEIKKAYRKLMSEYHPDKLMGKGVPEELVQTATEKSQEIQAAYELIRKYRKQA